MSTEAEGLIVEQERVAGITAKTGERKLTIRADLTIGADGRHSLLREEAGFEPLEIGAPMDVLWFRLSRNADDPGARPLVHWGRRPCDVAGGVGINLAIQDSIATANILGEALSGNETVNDELLARVQARREWPVKLTQAIQVFIQRRVISRVLGSTGKIKPPWFVRLFIHVPFLRRISAGMVGIGVQPERVKSPERVRGDVVRAPD
jgi:2-polyprenyl-6-methoxyphenol hydroxylase-like FAD-dependent oxidoreductase